MIKNIQKAIYALYAAGGDFKTGTPGGFHYGRAPQGTAFAYAVFQWLPLEQRDSFSAQIIETELQIRIFSNETSQAETSDLIDDAETMYGGVELVPETGYTARLNFIRALPPMKTEAVEGATWEGNIYFEIVIQR